MPQLQTISKKEESVFEQIKAQNGEGFAKAIRGYDSGIFDIPNIVNIVKYAGTKAEPIMQYLISLKGVKIEEYNTFEDPQTLLAKVGYKAEYADTLAKQNSIEKYFAPGEKLCTFRDPERFKNYHIINVIKENAENLKRSDFTIPKREDEYGTSVMSIQILKSGGFISIKNRYNHTVENPDNTFNSNPDNLILGLSESLRRYFGVDFSSQQVSLPKGYADIKGQIIKYHSERNNVYFGEDFYFKDGRIYELDKRTEVIMDSFIFNNETKNLLNPAGLKDSFISAFTQEIQGKKIRIDTDKILKHKYVYADGVPILDIREGEIVKLKFPDVTEIGDNFLSGNKSISSINLPNVKKIGNSFLADNKALRFVKLPNVKQIGHFFLSNNTILSSIKLPQVKNIGDAFLYSNENLTSLDLPSAIQIGNDCLHCNFILSSAKLNKIVSIGNAFLDNNNSIRSLNLPNVEEAGDEFLIANQVLTAINIPKVKKIGDEFLFSDKAIKHIDLPNIEHVGIGMLSANREWKESKMGKAIMSGDYAKVRALSHLHTLSSNLKYSPKISEKNFDMTNAQFRETQIKRYIMDNVNKERY